MHVMSRHILAVEFVGPIATRYGGWDGSVPRFTPSEWVLNTDGRAVLRALAEAGCYILVHTVLVSPNVPDVSQQVHELQDYLTRHGVPWDAVHTEIGKPMADLYVNTSDDLLRCPR